MRWRASWIVTTTMLAACSFTELPSNTLTEPGVGGAGGQETTPDPGCTTAEECGATGTECITTACQDGTCIFEAQPDLKPISSQAVGDCVRVVCDGEGGEKYVNDVDDIYDDFNECTDDTCVDGIVSNAPAPTRSCSSAIGGICNDQGNCVECIDDTHCSDVDNSECSGGLCVPVSCVDEQLSNGETDVDCGGSLCPPCADGDDCLIGGDCQSEVCTDLICQAPTCDDTVRNGTESDTDCGGEDCAACAVGQVCAIPSDCTSGVCTMTICIAPTCDDGVLNGNETDVDCGATDCEPCGTGDSCVEDADCASLVCARNKCQASRCNDGKQNGGEAGVDCGGSCPTQCAGNQQPTG